MGVVGLYGWVVNAASGLAAAKGNSYKYDYYNHLVHGLLKGQLYLDVEVPAALKTLSDPYDPLQNRDIGLIDTSYYNGHYYLYFGAAPAITLMLPFRWATGIDLPTGWAILIFTVTGYLTLGGTFLACRQRYFSTTPRWTAWAGVLLLGIGSMTGAVLRRPLFWELAVAGAYAFGMLALAALYRAIHDDRGPARWTAIAAVCLGLAAASRPTYLFAAPVLLVPIWYHARWRRIAPMILAAAIGYGAIVMAIGAYNYARFGNPLEFGHNYQLSVAYESKVRQFSPANFFYNLRLYYFLPARWSWQPPFVSPTPTPLTERPPGYYTVDDVYGLFAVAPFAILALFAPLAARARPREERRAIAATLAAPTILWITIGGILLFFVAAIARYMVDFVPPLVFLAAIGLLVVVHRTRCSRPRRWIANALIAGLGITTVAGGLLTCFALGHTIPQFCPRLTKAIMSSVSRLEVVSDRLHGRRFGPIDVALQLPNSPVPHRETLFRTGTPPEDDRVVIDYLPNQRVRLGVQHGNQTPCWGASQAVAWSTAHTIHADLGAFYPRLAHRWFNGVAYDRTSALTHRVELKFDDTTVLRTFDRFFPNDDGAPTHVDPSFSGTVLRFDRRVVDPTTITVESPNDLVLRVPENAGEDGRRLPLVCAGHRGAGDMLFLEIVDSTHARIGYDHWGSPVVMSGTFAFERSVAHEFALVEDETRWAAPHGGKRLLRVCLDGKLVWHSIVSAYASTPDEVGYGRNSNGHSTCATMFPGLTVASKTHETHPTGGALLMRVVLPVGVKGAWLPLLSIGHPGAADSFSIAYIDVNAIELRFDHWGAPLIVGRRIDLDENAGHDLEICLPSFSPAAPGHSAEGNIHVRWDGVEVMQTPTSAFEFGPDEVRFGERLPGTNLTLPVFTGMVVSHEWAPDRWE